MTPRRRLVAACLALSGCGRDLSGWWDVELWEITRGELATSRTDAGFVLFTDSGAAAGFSYEFDPVLFTLVPDADPDVVDLPVEVENTPEGEPDFVWSLDGFTGIEMDVLDDRGSSMTLESLDYWDGTRFHWELVR